MDMERECNAEHPAWHRRGARGGGVADGPTTGAGHQFTVVDHVLATLDATVRFGSRRWRRQPALLSRP